MQLKEFNIMVDIKKDRENENIEVVQNDYESNIFNIDITEDINPYNLEGLNVEIAFAKPDGTIVIQDEENGVIITNAPGGKLYCILNTNTIAAAGKVLAEVRILEEIKVLTTARFDFYVRRSLVDDKVVESSNELPILNRLIEQTNDLIDTVDQIEKQVPENVVISLDTLSNYVDGLAGEGRTDETVKGLADDVSSLEVRTFTNENSIIAIENRYVWFAEFEEWPET